MGGKNSTILSKQEEEYYKTRKIFGSRLPPPSTETLMLRKQKKQKFLRNKRNEMTCPQIGIFDNQYFEPYTPYSYNTCFPNTNLFYNNQGCINNGQIFSRYH